MVAGVSCAIALVCLAIAIDNLLNIVVCCRITEDCPDGAIGSTRCVDPTALYIALAIVGYTSASERTGNTKVIDATTEMTEQ
jgi:hypothetical protein